MQPTSKMEWTEQAFDRLKDSIKTNVEVERLRAANPLCLPRVVGIKLTNRCNLRCKHCYLWNESGYHHDMDRAEQALDLDLNLFAKVLEETRPVRSRLYLWGGEPLMHREIRAIFELLAKDPRETAICTNAHYLDRHLEALCRISANLDLLIALEGFEQQHDSLRGTGSFRRVVGQIDELVRLRKAGTYRGRISVHTVINDSMINRLYELMEFYEAKGIDLVLLCFPWYIADETSKQMDDFVASKFAWLIKDEKRRHSWDAFKYRISPLNVEPLLADLGRISRRTWKMRIRFQPELESGEVEAFVRGKAMTARCATTCSVLQTRVEITPSGQALACKFFPEFTVGNVRDHSLAELWQSEMYNKIRDTFGESLSPACSKCSALYLQRHSIPMHF